MASTPILAGLGETRLFGWNQVLRFHPTKQPVFIGDCELGGRVEPVIDFNIKNSTKSGELAADGLYGPLFSETDSTLPPNMA